MKYTRVTEEQYRADAAQSVATGDPVNGVKGYWPFAGLKYTRIEETISYDGFHVLMGIASYTLKTLVGERTVSQTARKFCRNTNSHPEIWPVDERAAGSSNNKGGQEGVWVLGCRKGVLQIKVDD